MLAPRTMRRNDSTVTSRAEGHQANMDRNYLLLWKFWCGRTSGQKPPVGTRRAALRLFPQTRKQTARLQGISGMTSAQIDVPAKRKPLRLWPGVVLVALQWLAGFVLPFVVPEAMLYGMLGGILGGGLAVVLWWLFFSRARWSERVGGLVLMTIALVATSHVVHESIRNAAIGTMLPMFAIPVLSLALVCWAVASRRFSSGPRRASLVAAILSACCAFTLLPSARANVHPPTH